MVLSELASRGETPVPAAAREKPLASEKLPPVDELVARIPEGVRTLLDDLFRAKYTTVRRYPPDAVTLSSPAPSAGGR